MNKNERSLETNNVHIVLASLCVIVFTTESRIVSVKVEKWWIIAHGIFLRMSGTYQSALKSVSLCPIGPNDWSDDGRCKHKQISHTMFAYNVFAHKAT